MGCSLPCSYLPCIVPSLVLLLTLKTTSNKPPITPSDERRDSVPATEEGDAPQREGGNEQVGRELGDVAERDGGLALVHSKEYQTKRLIATPSPGIMMGSVRQSFIPSVSGSRYHKTTWPEISRADSQ